MPVIPSPRQQRKGPKQVWKNASKRGKIGLVALCLVIPLSLCICVSTLATSTSGNVASSSVLVATPMPTGKPAAYPISRPSKTLVKVAIPTKVRTPKPTAIPPTAIPTQASTPVPPVPTQSSVQTGVNGNPWGYNFTPGNYIYSPNAGFCDYFTCVSTFWKDTNGYVAECYNGSYTHSGGISGACSRDGGVEHALYSH